MMTHAMPFFTSARTGSEGDGEHAHDHGDGRHEDGTETFAAGLDEGVDHVGAVCLLSLVCKVDEEDAVLGPRGPST